MTTGGGSGARGTSAGSRGAGAAGGRGGGRLERPTRRGVGGYRPNRERRGLLDRQRGVERLLDAQIDVDAQAHEDEDHARYERGCDGEATAARRR